MDTTEWQEVYGIVLTLFIATFIMITYLVSNWFFSLVVYLTILFWMMMNSYIYLQKSIKQIDDKIEKYANRV